MIRVKGNDYRNYAISTNRVSVASEWVFDRWKVDFHSIWILTLHVCCKTIHQHCNTFPITVLKDFWSRKLICIFSRLTFKWWTFVFGLQEGTEMKRFWKHRRNKFCGLESRRLEGGSLSLCFFVSLGSKEKKTILASTSHATRALAILINTLTQQGF